MNTPVISLSRRTLTGHGPDYHGDTLPRISLRSELGHVQHEPAH